MLLYKDVYKPIKGKKMKNTVIGTLLLTVALVVASLTTDKARKLINPEPSYEMIQLAKVRPRFVISQEDYNPEGKKYAPAVRLHGEVTDSNPSGFVCSGTVISNDYVVTAAHCLVDEDGKMLKKITLKSLKAADGSQADVEGTPIGINQRADYALIHGDFKEFMKTPINPTAEMIYNVDGRSVVTCGFPWGDGPACLPLLSAIYPCRGQMCAAGVLYPGMSGGPVIDSRNGVLVGVNTAVGDGYIVLSPLVGLFTTLDVQVQVK